MISEDSGEDRGSLADVISALPQNLKEKDSTHLCMKLRAFAYLLLQSYCIKVVKLRDMSDFM